MRSNRRPALAEAAAIVGRYIRNWRRRRHLCNASPAADTVPPPLSTTHKSRSADGASARTVSAEAFAESPGRTVLSSSEVVTAISL
jgi:CO/xanthine dehydrogenase FAD-binding subunit